jgi:hypothetical protein
MGSRSGNAAYDSAPAGDWNRTGLDILWADAELALTLADITTTRDDRETIERTIHNVHRAHDDLSRRREALWMTAEEAGAFQMMLDRLKTRLRFFGESV